MKEPVLHCYHPDKPEHTACGVFLALDQLDRMMLAVNKVTCRRCKRTDAYLLACYEDAQREYDTDG